MSEQLPRSRAVVNPPSCPSCHESVRLALEQDAREGDERQVWRCERCGVRWQVSLTPRSER